MKISILPRRNATRARVAIDTSINVIVTLVLLSLVFLAAGANPLQAIWVLISTGFSSTYAFSEVLVKTAPLILTGLAVAVALKMRLWNIGADGQLYMGALGTIWACRMFADFSAPLLVPILLLSSMAFGALWSGIAGLLKMKLNVNEILTTLMLNYVATSLVAFFVYGPWKDPMAAGFPRTAYIPEAAELPQFAGTRVHMGLLFAVVAALLVWFLLHKTVWGFEIRMTGESQGVAQYAGINTSRNTLLVFLLCGALAGLAGMGEISGVYRRLQQSNLIAGYGNYGVIVAWLAKAHPLHVIWIALVFAAVLVGADTLQVEMGISSDIVQIILGAIMCSVLCIEFFRKNTIQISFRAKEENAAC